MIFREKRWLRYKLSNARISPKMTTFFCKMTTPLQTSLKYHQKRKMHLMAAPKNRNKAACEMQILWSFRILLLSLCLEENNILTSFNPSRKLCRGSNKKGYNYFFSNRDDNVWCIIGRSICNKRIERTIYGWILWKGHNSHCNISYQTEVSN